MEKTLNNYLIHYDEFKKKNLNYKLVQAIANIRTQKSNEGGAELA